MTWKKNDPVLALMHCPCPTCQAWRNHFYGEATVRLLVERLAGMEAREQYIAQTETRLAKESLELQELRAALMKKVARAEEKPPRRERKRDKLTDWG